LGGADAHGVVPFAAVVAAGDNVALGAAPFLAAEALPDEPGAALLVGGHAVPEVGAGGVAQAHLVPELAVLVGPPEQVPAVLALAGPHDPERVVVRRGQRHAEVIVGTRDFERLGPLAVGAVALDEEDAVLLLLVSDPGEIMLAGAVAYPEG